MHEQAAPPMRAMRVAILGRPNVGKSTLFNRLTGRRQAIVADTPGVTRDRREGKAAIAGLSFVAIDTAGLDNGPEGSLARRMRRQSEEALAEADVGLLLVDGRAGLTEGDRAIALALRRAAGKPLLLVVNKCEGREALRGLAEFHELGLGEPIAISAEHGEGMADLFEALQPLAPEDGADGADGPDRADDPGDSDDLDVSGAAEGEEGAAPARVLKLAIVGRPNAGKSTLVNRLVGADRVLTGPEPGITRDAIRLAFSWRGKDIEIVDTAGIRRRSKLSDPLERLSVADTDASIAMAEAVVLLLDATRGLEAQDLRIAAGVLEEGRVLVVAINKWDVVEDGSGLYQGVRKALDHGLSQVKGVPLLTVSAQQGNGLNTLLDVAFAAVEKWSNRVPTSALNRWFEAALGRNPPPAPDGHRIRLRYITQARTRPPTFIVFGNRLDALPKSYVRYLVNSLRADLDLPGIPIRLELRARRNPYDD